MNTDINERQTLIRGLGLIAAVSVIIGNVIGTGVFFKARIMTCNVGEPMWVVAAWIAAGLLALAGSLTYAELTAMKPQASAEYVLLRDSYGKVSSFLYGWMQLFIAKTGSMAALAVAFAIALNSYLDQALGYTLLSIPVGSSSFDITTLQIIAIMSIIIFTTLNTASVALSGQIATFLTFIKVALVILVGVGAFLFVTGGSFANFGLEASAGCLDVTESQRYGHANYSFLAGFAAAMFGALWGYDGWNQLTFVAGEVKEPNRNIPLAIIGSTIVIIVLYVFIHVAYFYVLSPTAIASVDKDVAVANVIVEKFFAGDVATFATGVAVALFTMGLMLSSLGSLHTSILAGGRVPYAMAKDGLFFSRFANLSVNAVPISSLVLQGAWAIVLLLSDSLWRLYDPENALFDTLTNYVVFGSFIFYGLITSTVFIFRRRFPDAERPYRTFGYPIVPVIFLVVTAWLLLQTLYDDPVNSLIGIALILLGLPVYFYLTRSKSETDAG